MPSLDMSWMRGYPYVRIDPPVLVSLHTLVPLHALIALYARIPLHALAVLYTLTALYALTVLHALVILHALAPRCLLAVPCALELVAAGALGDIKGRVKGIEVPAVQMVLDVAQDFTETLEMDDLPFPQEPDGIADLRVFHHAEDIVIGDTRFLFCSKVLEQVGDGIAFRLEFAGIKGDAACGLRPDPYCVVDIIGAEAGTLDLLRGQVAGQLVDDRAYDL